MVNLKYLLISNIYLSINASHFMSKYTQWLAIFPRNTMAKPLCSSAKVTRKITWKELAHSFTDTAGFITLYRALPSHSFTALGLEIFLYSLVYLLFTCAIAAGKVNTQLSTAPLRYTQVLNRTHALHVTPTIYHFPFVWILADCSHFWLFFLPGIFTSKDKGLGSWY